MGNKNRKDGFAPTSSDEDPFMEAKDEFVQAKDEEAATIEPLGPIDPETSATPEGDSPKTGIKMEETRKADPFVQAVGETEPLTTMLGPREATEHAGERPAGTSPAASAGVQPLDPMDPTRTAPLEGLTTEAATRTEERIRCRVWDGGTLYHNGRVYRSGEEVLLTRKEAADLGEVVTAIQE